MPIDFGTPLGQVRLLITDVDEAVPYLLDVHINGFLAIEGDNVKRAAAQALDFMASNEALVQKRITMLDLSTDGPAVAKALREHAALLRSQAQQDLLDGGDLTGAFDIVETIQDEFAYREYLDLEGWRDAY